MGWERILCATYKEGWQITDLSGLEIFKIEQTNPPPVGRLLFGEQIASEWVNFKNFPATSESFGILAESNLSRKLGLKLGTIDPITAKYWVVNLFGFTGSTVEADSIEIREYFYRKTAKPYQFYPLIFDRIEDSPINSKFKNYYYNVTIGTQAPYTIGRFYCGDELISEPQIIPPITLEGFSVIFTSSNTDFQELNDLKVAIFFQ